MTSPALRGAPTGEPTGQSGPNIGQLCPDEVAYLDAARAAGRHISPSRARYEVAQFLARQDDTYDHGTGPTYHHRRRRQSLPRDAAVGERVAGRLT